MALKKKKFMMRFPEKCHDTLQEMYNEKAYHYKELYNHMKSERVKHRNLSAGIPEIVEFSDRNNIAKQQVERKTRGSFFPSFDVYKDKGVLRNYEVPENYPKIDDNCRLLKADLPESDPFYEVTLDDLQKNKFDFGFDYGDRFNLFIADHQQSSKVSTLKMKYLDSYGLRTLKKALPKLSLSPKYLGQSLSLKKDQRSGKKIELLSARSLNSQNTFNLYYEQETQSKSRTTVQVATVILTEIKKKTELLKSSRENSEDFSARKTWSKQIETDSTKKKLYKNILRITNNNFAKLQEMENDSMGFKRLTDRKRSEPSTEFAKSARLEIGFNMGLTSRKHSVQPKETTSFF